MAADRGINPKQARRLAQHLERAADRIEHDRRAATHELAAVRWPAPTELHGIAGMPDRLTTSARDLRRAADRVEHQKVRPFACFNPPKRHASNPFLSFGKGLVAGVTGTVKGLSHLVVDTAKTPAQMAGAVMHGRPPEAVVVTKGMANIHALWASRTTFWHASTPYLILETRRHGASRALDEWGYANGLVAPFVAITAATTGGGSSALATGLKGAGVPAATATRTAQAVGAMNPAPPPITDEPCDQDEPKAAA